VSERADTQTIFRAVQSEAARLNLTPGPGQFQAVTELRSLAAAGRNAAGLFARADGSDTFSPALAPQTINSRNLEDQAIFPEYMVRFTLQGLDENGNLVEQFVTMKAAWTPDLTVDQVRQQVLEAGEGSSNRYGLTFVGVSNLAPVTI
jgi:hypothetical protein